MFLGLYIISEKECLNPSTGAYHHIFAGLHELKTDFNVDIFLLCEQYNSSPKNVLKTLPVTKSLFLKKTKRLLKWLYILLSNHKRIFYYYKQIKKKSPDFIYERASYLNFNGLIISKLLRIPHFYEVNGILSKDNSPYFPSIFNKLSFYFEKVAYKNTFGFYVGGINYHYNIPASRYLIIQNGIQEEFVREFSTRQNILRSKINIVFIGHAMAHHRLDLLVEAINLLNNPESFTLHLIGSNLDTLKNQVSNDIETILYGNRDHKEIANLIKDFNIGIIPYALPYFSHVKAFMYGAAKLLLILPETRNFKSIFSNEEVLFIKNGDSYDLAQKLNAIESSPHNLELFGDRIYSTIRDNFTWNRIYEPVRSKIRDEIKG